MPETAEKLILHVCEGEKCAEALQALGFLATTSQGGSGRPHETDWTPAARFDEVILWQDVDAPNPETGIRPGEHYTAIVSEKILEAATLLQIQAPAILIVNLRSERDPLSGREVGAGMADGEDVFDLIESLRIEGKDDAGVVSTLTDYMYRFARRTMKREPIKFPNQPEPLEIAAGERAEIANFIKEKRQRKKLDEDGKPTGETEDYWVYLQRPMDEIRSTVMKIGKGWPSRLCAPGARTPTLFLEEKAGERIRWIPSSEVFESWMHEIGTLKFNPKQDCDRANYVKTSNLFHYFGGSTKVNEFLAVESRPHEPLIPKHYYAWRPPAGYEPDGRYLLQMLNFFTNAKDNKARALIAAAFLTGAWGGPYGKRPCIVVTAPDRGCGKTTLTWAVGKVWGGLMDIELGKHAEEELITRLLSPDALTKRVAVLDNVKGVVSSPTLEKLVTCEVINGRRLYTGDASRPNTLMYFITANGVRLSRDMGQRSFFVELNKPSPSADWERSVNTFVALNADYVVADCIALLRDKKPVRSLHISDRWSLWCEEVLLVACTHPALAAWVEGVDIADVLKANNMLRDQTDEDREEAEIFMRGVLGLVCKDHFLVYEDTVVGSGIPMFVPPKEPAFVASEKMCEYWERVFGRKVNTKWLKHQLRGHRESGRIVGIDEKHSRTGNGYEISMEVLARYVKDALEEHEKKKQSVPISSGGGAD